MQLLKISRKKWDQVTMDFVNGLPQSPKGNNAIWVVVVKLTKSAHFLPFKTNLSLYGLARFFVKEVVRLHGVPTTIVSDRDSRLTTHFWVSFQKAMRSKLAYSTAFHLQSDGQYQRTFQTLEDMLRSCVMDLKGSWEDHFPLV